MSAPERPILEIEQVSAGEGEQVPIRDVTLGLARGEVLAVVALDLWGGRSTLLETASGQLEPWRGVVRFDGEDVYRMDHAATQRLRARVGVVSEATGLLANLTVWDNVALPLRYHAGLSGRELTVRVDGLLARAGYAEEAHVLPWRVSGRGRRQAAFARALARGPDLVVVDGFFEGLEMPDWRHLFEVVTALSRTERTAWLLACEVDPVVFSLADTVAVLERGRLVARGTRRQLFEVPRIAEAFHAADASTLRRKSQRWTSLRTPVLRDLELDAMETIDVGSRVVAPGPAPALAADDPDATVALLEPAAPSPAAPAGARGPGAAASATQAFDPIPGPARPDPTPRAGHAVRFRAGPSDEAPALPAAPAQAPADPSPPPADWEREVLEAARRERAAREAGSAPGAPAPESGATPESGPAPGGSATPAS